MPSGLKLVRVRTEGRVVAGLSVPCARCGRMMSYARAWYDPAKTFAFYHEECARAEEDEHA